MSSAEQRQTDSRLLTCSPIPTDSLLDEGDALLFRSAIALVSLLSARLYVPDKGEVSVSFGIPAPLL